MPSEITHVECLLWFGDNGCRCNGLLY